MDRASIVQLLLMQFNSRPRKTVKWIMCKSDTNFFLFLLRNDSRYIKIYRNPIIDESIEKYEYNEYQHITGTNLYNGGDIRISIESQYAARHSSECYLIFEGCLTKPDFTAYANADEVALKNNPMVHLFGLIEHHLSNQLIKSLNYPGQVTTVFGLQKYRNDFSIEGLNQSRYKNTARTVAKPDNN